MLPAPWQQAVEFKPRRMIASEYSVQITYSCHCTGVAIISAKSADQTNVALLMYTYTDLRYLVSRPTTVVLASLLPL